MADEKVNKLHANTKDISGERFGRLVALSYAGKSRWLCQCDCGGLKSVRGTHLASGSIVSCGCYHDTCSITHGMCRTKEYIAWRAAKSRCFNPRNPAYSNYGGRGITMSKTWSESFEQFLADMGHRPDHGTLERRNNDGHYENGNCAWVTQIEQMGNQRKTIHVTHNGTTLPLRGMARHLGIPYSTLRKRYDHGKPLFKDGRNQARSD